MKVLSSALILLFCASTYFYAERDKIQDEYIEVSFIAADDIEFDYGYQNLTQNPTPVFNLLNASPGDTITKYLKVENNGQRKIDYYIDFDINEITDIIDVLSIHIEKINGESQTLNANELETIDLQGTELEHDDQDIYKITMSVEANAGNHYNRPNRDLRLVFSMNFNYWKTIEKQTLPLCDEYFGSVHERNWVKSNKNECGFAEMKFPKIYSGNGWSIQNGKLQYEGVDIENNDVFSAAIGIKTDELLADNRGYHVSSVTVNGEELINMDLPNDKWIESTHDWDLKKGLTHQINLRIGRILDNGGNLSNYQLEELTHEIRITLENNYQDEIIYTLTVTVGEHGNNQ